MKKYIYLLSVLVIPFVSYSQCTTDNAVDCYCADGTQSDCDLLPDITVSWEYGTQDYTEYPPGEGLQQGEINYVDNWFNITPEVQAMGRIRVGARTPNIGVGPLNLRGADQYGYRWMICYDSGEADTFQVYDPNWDESSYCPDGSNPKHLVWQRVFHRNGDGSMSFYEELVGTMEYHPTHGHMHFDEWTIMSLRVPDENNMENPLEWPIVGNGAKVGFCVMDLGNCSNENDLCRDDESVYGQGNLLSQNDFPNYGLGGGGYGCSPISQGISSGFNDTYGSYLDGMFLNIPLGTCNGDYAVVLEVPQVMVESNLDNNYTWFPVTLTQQTDPNSWVAEVSSNSSPDGVCSSSGITLTATYGTSYLWSTGETTQSIEVSSSGTYSVEVTDENCGVSGTSEGFEVTVIDVEAPMVDGPTEVGFNEPATLTASGNGVLSWYDQEVGGNLLADGAVFTTPSLTGAATYYASNVILGEENNYSLGEAEHTGSSDYGGDQYNSYLEFDVFEDVTLHSVVVFSDYDGIRKIQVTNELGDVVCEDDVMVEGAENGQLINLEFFIPAGDNYRIGCDEQTNIDNFDINGPYLKRTNSTNNNPGTVDFPYESPVLTITNSTYDGYYYYFYDWDFTSSSSCEARTEHNISVNNGGGINRWICTDNLACIEVNDGSGQYESLDECEKNCSATNVGDENLGLLRIYPNPNNGTFIINGSFESVKEVKISVINSIGQEVLTLFDNGASFEHLISLKKQNKGLYFVSVSIGQENYTEKVVFY